MSDKKNIDRLFQEKFKDFEAEPSEHIWINIDAALREKKKRRVVPFWFKLTGIAAGLILGFFALNLIFNNSTSIEGNEIVTGKEKQSNGLNAIESKKNESSAAADTENSKEKNNPEATDANIASPSINQRTNGKNDLPLENKNSIVNQNHLKNNDGKKINPANAIVTSEKNDAIATAPASIEKTDAKKTKAKNLNTLSEKNQRNAVANNESKAGKNQKTDVSKTVKGTNTNSISKSESNNAVAYDSSTSEKSKKAAGTTKNSSSIANSKEDNAIAIEDKNNSDNNKINKKSLNDTNSNSTIVENQKSTDGINTIIKDNFPISNTIENLDKKDSTAVAAVEPNALEELQKKNEEERNTIAEAKMNRWQITSNVAPIYFSSTSNGSPIDGQFAENNKSYENNLSFGIGVNYAVNKKLSVRTGVNKFTLGYNTNDVVFFAAMDRVTFGSLASSSAGATIQVISQNNSEALRPFDNDVQNTNEGIMTQRMGYFEVPLEMSYKLIDKKFGVNVIGGLSTLFLNENEVSVSSSTMSASLGKAKNLNDVHFSTNVGIGFKYRFWKSFEANFEPMFKYQINTFNKDAGNFKPYFIGLYSGVSFNF